jgi:hypothetical protein
MTGNGLGGMTVYKQLRCVESTEWCHSSRSSAAMCWQQGENSVNLASALLQYCLPDLLAQHGWFRTNMHTMGPVVSSMTLGA